MPNLALAARIALDKRVGGPGHVRGHIERGEDQAAYYLGQLFETGAGVPRDVTAARAWYQHAEPTVRSAKRRLAGLDVVESTGELAPPVPLLGGPLPNGTAEFVWSGGIGAAPEYFVVEMAAAPDAPVVRLGPTGLTAVSTARIDRDKQVWRVLAIRPTSSDYTVSDWYMLGQADERLSADAGPVRPAVSLGVVGNPVSPHFTMTFWANTPDVINKAITSVLVTMFISTIFPDES